MKKIVLDSCIFIKLFIAENDSDKALKIMEKVILEDMQILTPELFNYEVFSVYCANKSELKLKNIFTCFKKFAANITKIPLTHKLIESAVEITKHGTPKSEYPSFYDAIYHAIAIKEKCTFVTADEKYFLKTHKKFGHIKLLKNV